MVVDARRLPGIVGIGAQKAGTSWLHENLSDHPSLWAPPFKELHFFDFKFTEDSRKWAQWHVKSNLRRLLKASPIEPARKAYLVSLMEEPLLNGNWYKRIFSAAEEGKIGFDVTPEYCSLPENGIEFFGRFLGSPKVIYIIRDPIERAISQIKMNMHRKKLSFQDLSTWEKMARDPVIKLRGDYQCFIPRWDRIFGNILYLPFGEIGRNPISFLRSIEEYCGLPSAEYPRAFRRVFATPEQPVPESIRRFLLKELSGQVEFLNERFGSSFALLT